jgi:hypothetical protein
MKKIIGSPLAWVILLTFLPLIPLFNTGLPATHDGQDHVARIANFYASLREGNLVPRWASNLNWGYGHPILMFLYPLPSYIASFFHFTGFSFVDSVKLVFGISFLASAFTMCIWLNGILGKRAAVIGTLLYVFAPYRFVDLYVRGAIGEHAAFVFPPLILFILFKLAKSGTKYKASNVKYGIGLAFTMACMNLSHNAISLIFIPIIALYVLYLYFFESNRSTSYILNTICYMLLGFGLSAFFWVPALFEGKYTLRDIVTAGEAVKRFVPWTQFFCSPWNYGGTVSLPKSLGFLQWLGIIIAFVTIKNIKDKKIQFLLVGFLVILFLSLFIMTSYSKPIWLTFTTLQKFQFPWRFLSLSVFCTAVIGAIVISRLRFSFVIAYCLLLIFSCLGMWHPKTYLNKDSSFYNGIYPGTTDTGESSPIWSVRFMEHTPANPLDVAKGDATIAPIFRNTTTRIYIIVAKTQSRLVENTLFFPGWTVTVDGIKTGLQFQDPNYRGLMVFWVDPGKHTVVVKFGETKLRRTADYISLASFTVVILFYFINLFFKVFSRKPRR